MPLFSGMACFSPSVPSSIKKAWVEHGGVLAVSKSDFRCAKYFFCIGPSDPWLSELLSRSKVAIHAAWVSKSISELFLGSLSRYVLDDDYDPSKMWPNSEHTKQNDICCIDNSQTEWTCQESTASLPSFEPTTGKSARKKRLLDPCFVPKDTGPSKKSKKACTQLTAQIISNDPHCSTRLPQPCFHKACSVPRTFAEEKSYDSADDSEMATVVDILIPEDKYLGNKAHGHLDSLEKVPRGSKHVQDTSPAYETRLSSVQAQTLKPLKVPKDNFRAALSTEPFIHFSHCLPHDGSELRISLASLLEADLPLTVAKFIPERKYLGKRFRCVNAGRR